MPEPRPPRAGAFLARVRPVTRRLIRRSARSGVQSVTPAGGLVLRGRVWTGHAVEAVDGVVVVDGAGVVVRAGAGGDAGVDGTIPRLGGPGHWIGPGVLDACIVRGGPGARSVAGGVLGRRVVGGTLDELRRRRTGPASARAGGPLMTGPWVVGGVPRGDLVDGHHLLVDGPARGRAVVHRLAAEGSDAIAVDLDSGPSLDPGTVRAVIATAHSAGLPVFALALRTVSVARAVECGIDEFVRCPVERLPDDLVQRVADAGTAVTSTLQSFFSAGQGRDVAYNAAALVEAGAVLRYGTFGNGTHVDPRELDRLADAGLGRLGALQAATAGWRPGQGAIEIGRPAALVLLPADPLVEPGAWRIPVHVCAGSAVTPAV